MFNGRYARKENERLHGKGLRRRDAILTFSFFSYNRYNGITLRCSFHYSKFVSVLNQSTMKLILELYDMNSMIKRPSNYRHGKE